MCSDYQRGLGSRSIGKRLLVQAEYFLNILMISALNVLRTFLNIIVSYGCINCYFSFEKPGGHEGKIIINTKNC